VTAPKRRLGLTVTAAIVVANMIGSGVFTSSGFQAASLHDPMTMLACWVVGGVIALCGAAAYAELGSMMPRAGGEYVYLSEAYHPAVGFMSGWASLTVGFSAPIAAAALGFSIYLAALVPGLHAAPWMVVDLGVVKLTLGMQQMVAIALVVAITALHSFDTKVGGWVQAAFTALKVLLIVAFIIAGLLVGTGDWNNLATVKGGLLENLPTTAFATSLMYVSFAYSGWNAAAYIANEVERPERNLPRALLLGTGVVMALYVLLNLVFLYAIPPEVMGGKLTPELVASKVTTAWEGGPIIEVGDVAARNLFGTSAGGVVSAVISIALISSVSAMIMAGPRVYAAMAINRALPHQLATFNKRGVPVNAVLVQGVLATVFILIGNLDWLFRLVGFTLAIFAALTVGAVFILRKRGQRAAYRTWGYPVTPIAFIVLSAWIAFSQFKSNPKDSLFGLTLLGFGVILYMIFVRNRPALADESLPDMPKTNVPEARVVKED
jgi:APA family basic amino acid/polyamine antiporter